MPHVSSGRPRRRPYPNDCVIEGQGFMLGAKEKDAQLVISSTTEEPEQTYTWDDFSGGFGQKFQQGPQDNRYYYGLHVNPSIGDAGVILGYKLNSVTPGTLDATNGITHFFEMDVAGTTTLFALNGRYCLYRSNDSTWSVSKDFGAAKVALDVVTFQANIAASTNYAYVAMGASEFIWRFDAASATTTWTQHASLYALAFASVGRQLYRATEELNLIARVDEDSEPWTAANWTAPNQFRTGDKSTRIVRMIANAAGTLVVLKRSSIHVLDYPSGDDIELYKGIKFTPDAENGKYPFLFDNNLHVTYNGSHYAIAHDMGLDPVGPERLAGNDSIVRGYITAGVGTPFAAYAGLYNPDTGNSHLMQYGAYPKGSDQREDVWHGSISPTLTGVKITAAFMSSVGADSGHRRAYFGLSDGTIRWIDLPCVPNPKACSSVDFPDGTVADSANLFLSYTHFGVPEETKHLHGATVEGTNLTSSGSVQKATLALDTNTMSGSYSSNPTGDFDTTPGESQDYATDTTRTQVGIRLGLRQTSDAADNTTPQVTSVSVDYAVRPQLQRVYEFLVLAENGLLRRDGSRLAIGAEQIRTLLRTARNTAGTVTVYLPDGEGTAVELAIDGYEETQAWSARTRQWHAAIRLRGVETAKGAY